MADRLRELLDAVIASLDDRDADGASIARDAHFSRDHLDRVLAGATGETPVALRRRLLLERAAWELHQDVRLAAAAEHAGYGSAAAFSRAFRAAFGMPPSRVAATRDASTRLDAPNGIHFHPPGGLLLPGRPEGGASDLTARLVDQHLDRVHDLLAHVDALPDAMLDATRRPGLVVVWFEGEETTIRQLADRLVATLEVWIAAVAGERRPEVGDASLTQRLARVGSRFAALARTVRDRNAWDDAFVDALCEPPEAFTYGGVLAHVLTYGAIRREELAGVLAEAGVPVGPAQAADPIIWERSRA